LDLTQEEKVLALLNSGKGYLTAKLAREKGITNVTLQRMAKRGQIDRVARGLYIDADVMPDQFYVTQYRCPKAIFSHETALFLHGFSDRNPLQLMMTIPSGWNTKLIPNDNIMFFYSGASIFNMGAAEVETPYGLTVKAYDIERTICDCLRNINKLDKDLVLTALKFYMKDPGNDKSKLLEYATIFKIRGAVFKYMEVLS